MRDRGTQGRGIEGCRIEGRRDAGIAHTTWGHSGDGNSLERVGLRTETDHGTCRRSERLWNKHKHSHHLLPTESKSKTHQSGTAKEHLSASMVPSQH